MDSARSPLSLAAKAGLRLSGALAGAMALPERTQATAGAGTNEDWGDIRKALQGEGDAYARLVQKYQDTIAKQMWRFCREQSVCEELTQEVFVEAYISLKKYRGDAPLLHWLRRIATRVGYQFYKRRDIRRAQGNIALQDWDQANAASNSQANAATEAAESAEAAAIVHAMLAQLPPRDRLVLTLMYLQECSVAEVADQTGWSQTMVKVQAHRARKKLKQICGKVL